MVLDGSMEKTEHADIYEEILAGFSGDENELIAILLRLQERDGYVSPEAVRRVSGFLKITENQIFGVASFYPKFRFSPPGKHTIKVCMGTACHVHDGRHLADAVGWELGISLGQRTPDGRFDFQRVTCLGCCTLAPVVQVDDDIHARVMVTQLKEILKDYA
jgi:NADH-quinone oxidoreductase subunit E